MGVGSKTTRFVHLWMSDDAYLRRSRLLFLSSRHVIGGWFDTDTDSGRQAS